MSVTELDWVYDGYGFRATLMKGKWGCEFYHPSFSWVPVGDEVPDQKTAMRSAEQEFDKIKAVNFRSIWDEDFEGY